MRTRPNILLAFPTRLGAYALTAKGDGGAAESWIQVAITGEFESARYGKFSITKADLAQMLKNFSSGKFPEPPTEICMDYDHLSMAPAKPGDGKAAGWFKALALREDGDELWARIEWTEAGAEAVQAGEYKFVSPSFHPNFTTLTGEQIGCTLLAAAITNHPFLQGMTPMSLSMGGARGQVSLAVLGDSDKRIRVDEAICRAFHDPFGDPWCCYLVEIFESTAVFYRDGRYYSVSFTLADDGTVSFDGTPVEVVVQYAPLGASGASLMATPKNVISLRATDGKDVQIDLAALEELSLVKELRAKVPAEGSVIVPANDFTSLTEQVRTLSTQVTDLSATVTAEKKRADDAEKQLNTDRASAKVAALIAAGKLTPAQQDWAKGYALSNPTEFDAFAATLTPVLQLNRSTGSGQGAEAGSAEALLEAKAKELMLGNKDLSHAKAYDLAIQQHPNLYAQYEREKAGEAK